MKKDRSGAARNVPGNDEKEGFPPAVLYRRGARFHVLSNLFHRHFAVMVSSRHGIDMVEARVIESALHSPGVIAKEIIDFWAYDKMAVSRAIRRLEKKGMLQRRANRRDRRRSEIFLTVEGKDVHRALATYKDYVKDQLEGWLGSDQIGVFSELVESMIEHLSIFIEEEQDKLEDPR